MKLINLPDEEDLFNSNRLIVLKILTYLKLLDRKIIRSKSL